MAYVDDFTALTTGRLRWNKADAVGTPTVVTYSFLAGRDLPDFSDSPPVYPWAGNRYVGMTSSQRAAIRDALAQFEAKSGLRFVEVGDADAASVKFLGNQSRELTSWAYLPQTPKQSGDIITGESYVTITYDPSQSWTMDNSRGNSIYTVMLHEIGHAIGLEHPHDGVVLTPSMDNHDHTIMSYDWHWSGWDSGRARDTLAPLDVDAIRYLYGSSAGYSVVWRQDAQVLVIDGGAGDDRIVTGKAASIMLGGTGDDRLTGAQFNDTLRGGDGNDQLTGGAGQDRLFGQPGRDRLLGGGGNDQMDGGDGNDILYGQAGNDRLYGQAGDDRLLGGAQDDHLLGGAGADVLVGASENDRLSGGAGADRLDGGSGNDTLVGGADADLLSGGHGQDHLVGGSGQDRLLGGGGRDQLNGGQGNDLMTGGASADVFVFLSAFGQDQVLDWQDGEDRISLGGRIGFDDFSDVAAVARQRAGHVLITLDAESIIVLRDTALSELDARDFIF